MTRTKKELKNQPPEKRRLGRPDTGTDHMRSLRASDTEWANWQDAAEFEGMTLSAWIRKVSSRAASRVLRRIE